MPANKFLFSVLTYRPFRLHFSEYHQPHSWPRMSRCASSGAKIQTVLWLRIWQWERTFEDDSSLVASATHSGALSLARPTLFTCPLFILLSSCVTVSYVSLPMTQFLYTEGWYFIFPNVLPIPNSCTQYQAVHNGHFIYLFALSWSATPQSCLETSQVNPQGVSCLSLEATS